MTAATTDLLRVHAPIRVLDGFGRAARAACRYVAPRSTSELLDCLSRARAEGLSVAFRGAGRSYGDASLNREGLVLDTSGLCKMRSFDVEQGIVDAEPGLTIEDLWRRTIEDGYWPAVVPGTMRPTLAGCASANIHGKNHFRAGSFGEHVLDFDLVTASGELLRCSREENADVFRGAIGGMGLLGAITRVRLRLRPISSGLLRVTPSAARDLDELFDRFEEQLSTSDYLVGWVDCMSGGKSLGRGAIHAATYVSAGEHPEGRGSLHVERQGLPETIAGLPRSEIWQLMRLVTNDPGMRLVNALKYFSSRFGSSRHYFQSHVAFAFLLDYVTNWRLAYGACGFLQCQVLIPAAAARSTMASILRLSQERGLPPYLGVLKRHRTDEFLLSHAVDGYSLAMDFRVTKNRGDDLRLLLGEVTERVLEAGGRFYFAKDSLLSPEQTLRAYGEDRLGEFWRLKRRLDPEGLLSSDLSRRALPRLH